MIAPPCQGPHPNPSRPAVLPPEGTADCHFHVFGPLARFPYVAERSFTPPEAPAERYAALMDRLGVRRCVVVQPSVHGTDNGAQAEALRILGPRCRGVAVIDDGLAETELRALDGSGFRGVRFNLLFKGGLALERLERVAGRIAPLGWHLQLLVDGRDLPELAPRLARLPVEVVVDHMGHMPAALGPDHPGFAALRGMLAAGRTWVKVSAPYRLTGEGPPWPSVAPVARALIAANPERVVWASDWPHPAFEGEMPDDVRLVEAAMDWAGDAATRRRLFAANAAQLYGFDA